MSTRLSQAEAILRRTGPNNITVLFEADGAFDPARAFAGIHMMANGAERFRAVLSRRAFAPPSPVAWSRHVSILDDASVTAATLMDVTRRLALPSDRPLWRAVLVNPDGTGWSGLALQFDHAIADGTRIARHLVSNVRPSAQDHAPIDALPNVTLPGLTAQAFPTLSPAPIGLCRLPFTALRIAVPEAISHGDALMRLARRMLDSQPEFRTADPRRKNHATMARIEALQSGGRLGNHARMDHVDLSQPSLAGEAALFQPQRAPLSDKMRMATARLIPSPVLRRIVQAEFSVPGIVQTIVPVSRKPVALFGLPLRAIHPAAPALGRPLLAIAAARFGDGFDVSITARTPKGEAAAGLSQRVAQAMVNAVQ